MKKPPEQNLTQRSESVLVTEALDELNQTPWLNFGVLKADARVAAILSFLVHRHAPDLCRVMLAGECPICPRPRP